MTENKTPETNEYGLAQADFDASSLYSHSRREPVTITDDMVDAAVEEFSDPRHEYAAIAMRAVLEAALQVEPVAPSDPKCNCAYPEGHASYCPKREPVEHPEQTDREQLIEDYSEPFDHDDYGRGRFFTPDALDMYSAALAAPHQAKDEAALAETIRAAKEEAWAGGHVTDTHGRQDCECPNPYRKEQP